MPKSKKVLTPQEQFVKELAKAQIHGWKTGFQSLKDSYETLRKGLDAENNLKRAEIFNAQSEIHRLKEEIELLQNQKQLRVLQMEKDFKVGGVALTGAQSGILYAFRFPEKIRQPRLWYLNRTLQKLAKKQTIAGFIVHPDMEEFIMSSREKRRKYGDFRMFTTDKVSKDVVLVVTL